MNPYVKQIIFVKYEVKVNNRL